MKKAGGKAGLDVIERLARVIAERSAAGEATSYTAKLLAAAPHLPAKKLAEEAVELALAAVSGDRKAISAEAADVLYHLLVLLQASGVSLDEVCAVLAAREGVSGIAEKAGRNK